MKNRTYKFRAWDKTANTGMLNCDWKWLGERADHISDYVLMQATGLFDKSGKEIYEGSILEAVECEVKRDWPAYKDDRQKERKVRWSVYWDNAGYSLRSCQIDKYYPFENPTLQRYWEYQPDDGSAKKTEITVDRSSFGKRDYMEYSHFEVIGDIYTTPELLK